MPITVSHAKSNNIADFSGAVTVMNSSGGTTTAQATDLVRPSDWNSSHVASVLIGNNEIFSVQFWEPFVPANTNSTLSAPGVGTWYLDPIVLPFQLGSGQLNFLAGNAAGFKNGAVYSTAVTGSVTCYQTMNTQVVLYQHGVGANTTRLESIWSQEVSEKFTWVKAVSNSVIAGTTTGVSVSNALTVSQPSQWDVSGGITYGTATTAGTTLGSTSTVASTFADNLITTAVAYASGSRLVPIPFATQLPCGEYYLGLMISSTSSTTGTGYGGGTMQSTQSVMGMLELVDQAFKVLGKSVTNSSTAILPFHGSVATTSATPPNNIATSDIRNFATNHRRYFNYMATAY
jgi:hypothetical protein